MLNITISQKTYETIKADVTKLFERYVTIEDAVPSSQLSFREPGLQMVEKPKTVPQVLIEQALSMTTPPSVAPVAAAPAFPIQQAAPLQTVTSTEELDALGVKWNPDIHSSSKAKSSDGTWRVKRGLGKTLVKPAVALTAPTPVAPVPAAPPIPQAPVAATPVQQVAPAPIVAAPLPVPGQVQAHTVESFKANLVPIFAALLHEGKLTQEYVNQIKAYFGVAEIWQVMSDPQKLSELYENFCGSGFITRAL